MSAASERRAARGAIVAPLRGVGEGERMVPQHGARAPLRLVRGPASRAHHASLPCPQAFGGDTDDREIAEGEKPKTT